MMMNKTNFGKAMQSLYIARRFILRALMDNQYTFRVEKDGKEVFFNFSPAEPYQEDRVLAFLHDEPSRTKMADILRAYLSLLNQVASSKNIEEMKHKYYEIMRNGIYRKLKLHNCTMQLLIKESVMKEGKFIHSKDVYGIYPSRDYYVVKNHTGNNELMYDRLLVYGNNANVISKKERYIVIYLDKFITNPDDMFGEYGHVKYYDFDNDILQFLLSNENKSFSQFKEPCNLANPRFLSAIGLRREQRKFLMERAEDYRKFVQQLSNVDAIYGELAPRFYARLGRITNYGIYGDARNISGNISGIYGGVSPDLIGDVSGIKGDVTHLYGDCTGIEYTIKRPLESRTNIKDLINDKRLNVVREFNLLSNQDNITLMKVWNTLAHHTIGITNDERNLFDNPVKCKPPFPVDKWGRYYERLDKDNLIVISVNPADIMFAKDVNKCSTCFCLNSGSNKWDLGMRCLIALNSVNQNLGVAYVIKKDSIKKLNQFEGIKFKWYDPEKVSFFQYNEKSIFVWDYISDELLAKYYNSLNERFEVPEKIYGHDGMNQGHRRQKELAYLETFIKNGWRWYRGKNENLPLVNNYKDFNEDEISEEWKKQIEIANQKAKELKEYLSSIKE